MDKTLEKIRCSKCKEDKPITMFVDPRSDKTCVGCKRALKKKAQ